MLLTLGVIVMIVGDIMLLVAIFRQSVLWGLASLFIPLVGLIFIITHWSESKTPFVVILAGLVLAVVGVITSPDMPEPAPESMRRPAHVATA